MLVLGIESTCDETACAVVRDGREILSNVVSSQIELHKIYGGVVPELACRRHVDVIIPVIDEAVKSAGVTLGDIDLIAVAHGPGLVGALLIGLHAAKALSLALNIPFVGVNHVEAHLYAAIMCAKKPITYPALGVLLSGGHTALLSVKAQDLYTLIGQTVDDAIGEAFDKVAKILGLPYPGGPHIEALSLEGNSKRFIFKSGNVKGRPLDFSFSGLKTSVLYTLQGQNSSEIKENINEIDKRDIAASFQEIAFNDILKKTKRALKQTPSRDILFGGGVTNNKYLRKLFAEKCPEVELHWPTGDLSLDNASMIAGLGYHNYIRKNRGDSLDLEAMARIPFSIA